MRNRLYAFGFLFVVAAWIPFCQQAGRPLDRSRELHAQLLLDERFAGLRLHAEIPFNDGDVVVFLSGPVRSVADREAAMKFLYNAGPRIIGRRVIAVLNDYMPIQPQGPLVPLDWMYDHQSSEPRTKMWILSRRLFEPDRSMPGVQLQAYNRRWLQWEAMGPWALAFLLMDIEYTLIHYPFDKLEWIKTLIELRTGELAPQYTVAP